MNTPRFGESAHAAELDIDDPASAQPDRLLGMMGRADAFIETDGRIEPGLQRGVVDNLIVRQRLLDHHEIKTVELLEPVRIGQRVGGIGVGHQLDRREALAHFGHHVHVPARLDLHLDALIPGRQLALDLFN